ncbi:MAG: hypothetical protein K2O00_05270 [Muribaculaceae bacterium]|nr:hypothetical protein [Muribaculaceae bacterium]
MKENDLDRQLRETIKKELPEARRDEWFVRKTMNRLPDKQVPLFSRWERLAYLMSALILIVMWVFAGVDIINNPVLTVSSLLKPAVLSLMSLSLMAAVAVPYMKRS